MKDLNEIFLIGRLTRDPEVKYTTGGSCVFNFSIAVNTAKKVGEEFQDEPNFFDIVFWPKNVEYWAKQLYKGTKVMVHCEAKQDRWEKDGVTHSRVKFQCIDFPQVFPKTEGAKEATTETAQTAQTQPDPSKPAPFDDDIPF